MNYVEDDILMHYGIKRRSGRYPWGSGENPYQHSGNFVSRARELSKSGMTEKEIASAMGFESTTDYRVAYRIAKNEERRLNVEKAKSLASDGKGASEIGQIMGVNESTVRSWLNPKSESNMNAAEKTAEKLKEELKTKKMLDVGVGVERELGVSRTKLDEALTMLEYEGYSIGGVGVPNLTNPGKQTNTMVLFAPGVEYKEAYANMGDIQSVGEYHSDDGGLSWSKREYPTSINSDRVKIRYGDEGGIEKDGVIEIRPGVADLDLGKSHYAQVRILVDDGYYLKGMAMYSDDIPKGVDIVFNTNKKSGTPKTGKDGVLKEIKDDPDNPFGAYIKADGQSWYVDSKTGEKKLSAINKLKEEGDWDTMSRNLSSQFLSKQPMELINKQLKITYADKEAEFDEIKSYTNSAVKKKMLLDFAESCDAAVTTLKAAALPRQETRVILPLTAMSEKEVYAPYLKDGEKVALVRYPHAGTFEIPILTVNNKNESAKKILGNATDAIGINAKVAERLSGADFDGDTVVVIPTNSRVKITSRPALEGLKDFEPKLTYATTEKDGKHYNSAGVEVKLMDKKYTQKQMGMVSNLITDMTLRGAPDEDIVKAVKHSMVVIDAAKHKLDYKQSEIDNDIPALKKKWQPKYDEEGNVVGGGGASTLLSKRKQTVDVPETKGAMQIDKETGAASYKLSGRTYVDPKTGETKLATKKVNKLLNTDDVRTLSSGTMQEEAYADYANKMKALANAARKEYVSTSLPTKNSSAAKTYAEEVKSLDAKIDAAARNAPKERRAQALANSVVKAKIQENPELADKANKKDLNKVKRLALDDARQSVGASGKNSRIEITSKEWEAIQAGAVSGSKLYNSILRYADSDKIKKMALPKTTTQLSQAKINKINAMKGTYTIAQIAEALGVSTSTVSKYINQ
jgi:hypothetical protein